MKTPMITLKKNSYHRNGITGEGFRVATFRDHDTGRNMVAIMFPNDKDENGFCNPRTAVLDVDCLNKDDVETAFRGDFFHTKLETLLNK